MLEQIWRDVLHALRAVARRPAYAMAAVLMMALGIGVTAAVFTVIHGVLLRPLPYPEPDRLALVFTTFDQGSRGASTGPDLLGWREHAGSFVDVAGVAQAVVVASEDGRPARASAAVVTPNVLSVLGVEPSLGRSFTDEDGMPGAPGVVLVSDRVWRTRLGADPAALGRRLELSDKPYTVAGVMPASFAFPTAATDYWFPLSFTTDGFSNVNEHSFSVVARLRPGIDTTLAQDEAERIMQGVSQDTGRTRTLGVAVVPLHDYLVQDAQQPLWLMMGAVALVLLIAIVNVTHLMLGRSLGRRREMQVRASLGATPARILRHAMVEGVVLSLVGGALGAMLASWLVQALLALADGVPRTEEIGLNPTVLAFTVAVSVMAGLLSALLPAIRLARSAGRSAPEATRGIRVPRGRVAGFLIAGEVALSLVLLSGAGLLTHSFMRLANVNPGLDVDRLVAMRIAVPESRYPDNASQVAFARAVLDDLSAIPGAAAAGIVSHLPFEADFWRYGTIVPGRPDEKVPIAFRLATPGYFDTMGIRLVEGRLLTDAERAGAPIALVVNEAAARRMFPGQSAIGQRLDFSYCREPTCEIVGVVTDIRHLGLDQEVEPAMYASFWQKPEPWMREMSFVVRSAGDPAGLVEAVRDRLWLHDARLPMLRLDTLSNILAGTLAPRRFAMTIMAVFAAVAGLLAVVGIQGVVSRAVVERRQEIGLRLALGARPVDVVSWMTRRTMTPVVAGLAVGLAGAVASSRLLQGQLFELSPRDPATLATVSVVLFLAALGAAIIPSRRAAGVDHLEAMRD